MEVDDGNITLNYTVPLPPDSSKRETVSVLGIVPQLHQAFIPFVGVVAGEGFFMVLLAQRKTDDPKI